MRPLRYSINVTLDGCCDHRVIPADEESHSYWAANLERADGLLFGRVTDGMMVEAWRLPASGRGPDWMDDSEIAFARTITGRRSTSCRALWIGSIGTRSSGGDLQHAAQQLKREPGGGLFVGGVTLPLALAGLGLIDEYEFVVHPVVAGHGPTLFDGLGERLEQSSWGARSSGRGRWHCATSPVERRLEGRPPVRADLATPRQRRG